MRLLKIKRINRARGLNPFRTPKSDYLEFAPRFRSLCERGRIGSIPSFIHFGDVYARGSCAFDEDAYLEWATKIYGDISKPIWVENSWLDEEILNLGIATRRNLKTHLRLLRGKEGDMQKFIPIKWSNPYTNIYDILSFVEHLIKESPAHPHFRDLALLDSGRSCVLFARKSWLISFTEGIQICRYILYVNKNYKIIQRSYELKL